MKKLLLISFVFPPAFSAESVMLLKKVRVLARYFSITIITLDNKDNHFQDDSTLKQMVPKNVRVKYVPSFDKKSVFNRVLNIVFKIVFRGSPLFLYYDLGWSLNAVRYIKNVLLKNEDFDVLMSNSRNICSHLVGYSIHKVNTIPWVQHYSDPYSDSMFDEKWHYKLFMKHVDTKIEEVFIKRATVITVPSKELGNCICEKYNKIDTCFCSDKVIVIPHVYDGPMNEKAVALYTEGDTCFEKGNYFHICYLGSLYGPRSFRYILKVLGDLANSDKSSDKKIVIHLFGEMDKASKKLFSEYKCENIRFHGSVVYLKSLALMAHADALLLIDTPIEKSPYFPSKLSDYMGTDNPIIALASEQSCVKRIAEETHLIHFLFDESICYEKLNHPISKEKLQSRVAFSNRTNVYTDLINKINSSTR